MSNWCEVKLKNASRGKPDSSPVVGIFRRGDEWQAALFWWHGCDEYGFNIWLNEQGEESHTPFFLPLQTRLSFLASAGTAELDFSTEPLDEA